MAQNTTETPQTTVADTKPAATQVLDAQAVSVTETQLPSSMLINQIMDQTRLKNTDEGYLIAKQGVEAFLTRMLDKQDLEQEKVDRNQVNQFVTEIDRRLGKMLDCILHHPKFQQLESAWRSLKLLVDRTDFKENIRIQIINATKEELIEDFEDTGSPVNSGLYSHVYTNEYGQFGGEPVSTIVGNYSFLPTSSDLSLLRNIASVSAMSHSPFIAAAEEGFFGVDSFDELNELKDLESIFEGPQYDKWRAFRQSDDARNIGLTLPQFLLRPPYGDDNPLPGFNYQEDTEANKKNYLWGNTAFALASRITESFAKYRWSPNIVGPKSGGEMLDLALHHFKQDGQDMVIGPVNISLSDRKEFELSEQGFIPLTMRKRSDSAAFFSANSAQMPKTFGNSVEDKQAELNYRLGTQLPYLFIINRLAHYIKVLQRENLGSWKSRSDLERELNRWIRQYVADQENPLAEVRSRRPLRYAAIEVADIEGESGWYSVGINVTPHFKFMGASFTLSLASKIEKEEESV